MRCESLSSGTALTYLFLFIVRSSTIIVPILDWYEQVRDYNMLIPWDVMMDNDPVLMSVSDTISPFLHSPLDLSRSYEQVLCDACELLCLF